MCIKQFCSCILILSDWKISYLLGYVPAYSVVLEVLVEDELEDDELDELEEVDEELEELESVEVESVEVGSVPLKVEPVEEVDTVVVASDVEDVVLQSAPLVLEH